MQLYNAINSPGLRFSFARVAGHSAGRLVRWYSSLGTSWKICVSIALFVPPVWQSFQRQNAKKKSIVYNKAVKDCIFFDFAIGSRYIGRVLIGLYTDQLPMTCENFINLAQGYKIHDHHQGEITHRNNMQDDTTASGDGGGETTRNLYIGYRNTEIFKIIPDVGMVGGDVIKGDGSTSLSIYGPKFVDENFDMDFVQDGDVCMYTTSAHSNGSQFMITFRPLPCHYGYNVVFGTVIKGMRVIRMIEDLGTQHGHPMERIIIVNCGLYRGLQDGPPFFSHPEILERYDEGPLGESAFRQLSQDEQERQVLEQRRHQKSRAIDKTSGVLRQHRITNDKSTRTSTTQTSVDDDEERGEGGSNMNRDDSSNIDNIGRNSNHTTSNNRGNRDRRQHSVLLMNSLM